MVYVAILYSEGGWGALLSEVWGARGGAGPTWGRAAPRQTAKDEPEKPRRRETPVPKTDGVNIFQTRERRSVGSRDILLFLWGL